MLHRSGDEADGRSGHDAGDTVSQTRESVEVLWLSRKGNRIADAEIRKDMFKEQSPIEGERTQHAAQEKVRLDAIYFDKCKSYTESITIHPTSGGVAPLYNPDTPSLRTVCSTQSSGPLKWESLVV